MNDDCDVHGIPRPTVDVADLIAWVDRNLDSLGEGLAANPPSPEFEALFAAAETFKHVRLRLVPTAPMPELDGPLWAAVFADGSCNLGLSHDELLAANAHAVGTVRLVADESTWVPL